MTKQWRNIGISAVALTVGCILYVFLRSGTRIAKIFDVVPFVVRGRKLLDGCQLKLLRYYLPDYLWGLSLATALYAVDTQKNPIIPAGIAVCCGGIWEILQILTIISGTGDWWDVALYVLAGLSAIFINKRREK